MIDIYEHLRRLEFPASGSLMPSRWPSFLGGGQPRIVSSLSIIKIDMLANGYAEPRQIPTTLAEYLAYQRRLLWDCFLAPVQDLGPKTARSEIFSLHGLDDELERMASESDGSRETFVLSHTDLRAPNVLVDAETGGVTAVIDWEFACTIPAHHMTPPFWFIGLPGFQDVLDAKLAANPESALLRYWQGIRRNTPEYVVALIFQRPTDALVSEYRQEIFSRTVGRWDDALEAFFSDEGHRRELEDYQGRSERYTQYLKEHDLYEEQVETEEERRDRELRAQRILRSLEEYEAGAAERRAIRAEQRAAYVAERDARRQAEEKARREALATA